MSNKNGNTMIHLPGGLSITVNRPVLRVRLPDAEGAGECACEGSVELSAFDGDSERSSVQPTVWRLEQPLPCMYLKCLCQLCH